jgi:hypothetical protein
MKKKVVRYDLLLLLIIAIPAFCIIMFWMNNKNHHLDEDGAAISIEVIQKNKPIQKNLNLFLESKDGKKKISLLKMIEIKKSNVAAIESFSGTYQLVAEVNGVEKIIYDNVSGSYRGTYQFIIQPVEEKKDLKFQVKVKKSNVVNYADFEKKSETKRDKVR